MINKFLCLHGLIGFHHWICTCNSPHCNEQVMDSMALFAPMTLDIYNIANI